ncbi:hypothetical protein M0805_006723 [Coniferiporia weirii]|nr:hypothetical protein M0805_006723 [Coniferiporia weirii]
MWDDTMLFAEINGLIEEVEGSPATAEVEFDPDEFTGNDTSEGDEDIEDVDLAHASLAEDEIIEDINFEDTNIVQDPQTSGSEDEHFPTALPIPLAIRQALLRDEEESLDNDVLTIVKKNLKELRKMQTTGATMRNLMVLTAIANYVRLWEAYKLNPKSTSPSVNASIKVAAQMGKGKTFAHLIRFSTQYIIKHKKLPPYGRGKHTRSAMWLDNETICQKAKVYLASQAISKIKPSLFRKVIIEDILPMISATSNNRKVPPMEVALTTVRRWLRKLGYSRHSTKKGIYVDGHERPDVIESHTKFLRDIEQYEKLSRRYEEETLAPLPLNLGPGEREHILIVQDESIFHVNDQCQEMWLANGERPLHQKGNGHAIHISDFLCEGSGTGRLSLTESQLAEHSKLPSDQQLQITDVWKVIYPGKNHDKWWDMPQLLTQTKHAVDIFECIQPGATAIFVFDCSSAHKAFAGDALNVNNMNVNSGGKQSMLRDTIIPLNNPPPKINAQDTRGLAQSMVYPTDHPDADLRGKPKGMVQVLRERESVWDKLSEEFGNKRVVGVCANCKLSQKKKDALRRITAAEQAGQEDQLSDDDLQAAEELVPESENNWCCAKRILSLQQDFVDEIPMLQAYIQSWGHVCLFFPKFHCLKFINVLSEVLSCSGRSRGERISV